MTDNLITLLKDAINEKKKAVKEYNNHLDKNLSDKIEILDNLRNDINEITKIEISRLNEIVDSFQMETEEKENMKKELDIIKALLTLNQTEKTNYTLLANQLTIISSFLDNLEVYIDEKNEMTFNRNISYIYNKHFQTCPFSNKFILLYLFNKKE